MIRTPAISTAPSASMSLITLAIPLTAALLLLSCAARVAPAAPASTDLASASPASTDLATAGSAPAEPAPVAPLPESRPFVPSTKVSLQRGAWQINGKATYAGSRAEGLLLNARMVNSTFEDRNPQTRPADLDPDKNTAAFVARIPDYVAHGVLCFTLNLQGGDPGYEGALNSAYAPDGSLRVDYLARVARVIEACDRAGAVVILGCFFQAQDQVLKDADAVRKAVTETAAWLRDRGYTNVCLEIASEHAHKGYQHSIIREPAGIRELMDLARKTCPALPIASSGLGGGRVAHQISIGGDFVLLHLSDVPVGEILERVASADKVSKAIVCNEDSKVGEEGARALEAAVDAFCSWGYSNAKKNHAYPFSFEGAADDPAVYAKFKELSTP